MTSAGGRTGQGPESASGPSARVGSAGSPALGAERDEAMEARVWAREEYRHFPSAEDVFDHLPDEDADWLYDDAPEEAGAWDDDESYADDEEHWTDDGGW